MVLLFKNKEFRAAIFDMDGTMFDTERLRFSTLRQASLQLHGQTISDEILYGSLGLSAKKAKALAQQHFGENYPYEAIRKRADELELKYVRKYGVPIKPGLYEVLERLKKNGMRLAVATSTRRAIAEEYLISARVLRYFDATVCGDEVVKGKPDPEIFRVAAREISCAPNECLIMEDSENGLKAALAAGGHAVYLFDLKHPPASLRKKVFAGYDSMDALLDDLRGDTQRLPPPRLIDPFPAAHSGIVAGIHGFGAIGGGYLAQIFSHWDGYVRPHKIIGVTSNRFYRGVINHFGKYRVRYPHAAFDHAIEGVDIVDSADEHAVCQMYVQAEIVGLCLAEQAIAAQAPLIAKGLYQRFEQHDRPLVMPVLMNKLGAAAWVRSAVATALQQQVGIAVAAQVLARVSFVETVVNRIVSKVPREAVLKQLRVGVGGFEQAVGSKAIELGPSVQQLLNQKMMPSEQALPMLYDKLGKISALAEAAQQLNVTLFHSSPDMLLYAQKGEPLLDRLRQIRTVDDIAMVQTLKNRLLNGTHAILAWYSSLLGYRTVAQGMGDERVAVLVRRLAYDEIRPALEQAFPDFTEHADAFMGTFLQRCRSSFKDTCTRVGRDPLRKLQRDERVMGSILLAQRLGMATPMLEYGVALGILYALRAAPESDKEAQRIKAVYRQNQSVRDVLCWRGNYAGAPYQGLDAHADAALIGRIAGHFKKLAADDAAHWQWPLSQRSLRPTTAGVTGKFRQPVAW